MYSKVSWHDGGNIFLLTWYREEHSTCTLYHYESSFDNFNWLKPNRVTIMLNLIMTDHILNVIIVITKVIINLSCRIIYLLAIKSSPSSMFSRYCKSGNLRVRKIYTSYMYVVPWNTRSAYGKKNQNFSVLNQASANLTPKRFVWL